MPTITTISESLYWSYANLAMAHAAIVAGSPKYTQTHFIIRSKLYKGLNNQNMLLGSFVDDERLKMILPQACNYCGSRDKLSIDHLIPKAKGGADKPENMVWACRSCNSAKRDTDLLAWYQTRDVFPPLLLLRRYLKIAVETCNMLGVLSVKIEDAPSLPFALSRVPHVFPQPSELILWVVSLD
jgi:hypothetical protein